jgi:hypothetical protein
MINPRYPYNPEEFSDFFDQAVEGKQDTLVSGENIKTINGESILGSGDLTIEGGGGTPTGYYGQYQDGITQTAAVANTGYPIKFRTSDYSNGVSVVSNSRITIANTGIYNLQFSVQLENSSNQEHDATIWLRKNGTDVPGSAGFISVVSSHGGVNGHCIVSWNYLLDAVGRDYYELVWSVTNTAVTMPYYAGANPPPSAASAIFTVTQQAGIMAGTGMTALNGLTNAVQTISTGTTGSDFNVASSGTIHTFNLPTASATKRGALSTTDWSTFNSKESSITAGTTAQYYRGDKTFQTLDKSAVGLGNVDNTSDANKPVSTATSTALGLKQDTLVSGTSIKTVNSTSLLGSGDITTNPRTLASVNGSNLIGLTNQISASVLIPANTISTNNTIYIKALLTKTAGSSTSTPRVYINTTNSLTGATLLASGILMNTTIYFQRFERNIFFDGTNLNGYNSALSTGNDYASSAITLTAFNPATPYYLIFAVQNSSTTPDNLGWKRVIVQIYD